jgi:hypothetical protein
MVKNRLIIVLTMVLMIGPFQVNVADRSIDPYLESEVKVSPDWNPPGHSYRPQVAFDPIHNQYLVVWHTTWDDGTRYVYARRLDLRGRPITQAFPLSTVINLDVVHPNVTYNFIDNEFMVVWMQDVSGNNTRYEIWGTIIPWNASGPGTTFSIGNYGVSVPFNMWYPSVAWNSIHNEYLVIWDTYLVGNPPVTPQGIAKCRVTSAGPLGYPNMITVVYSPINSDLVYNPAVDEYLVVWERSESGQKSIYASRLNWDTSCARCSFLVYNAAGKKPAVATNQQNRYLVGWHYNDGWDEFLEAQRLDAAGNLYGDHFYRTYEVDNLDVASSGNSGDWFVAYEMAGAAYPYIDGYHLNWLLPGNFNGMVGSIYLNDPPRITRNVAIAGGNLGFLFVYEGRTTDPTSRQHIYARKYWQSAVFLPLVLR